MPTTESTAHTPGPWRTSIEYRAPGVDAVDIVSDYAALIVGQANFWPGMDDQEAAANARLIAAAPDLLAALKHIIDMHAHQCSNVCATEPECEWRQAKAAIAKAGA